MAPKDNAKRTAAQMKRMKNKIKPHLANIVAELPTPALQLEVAEAIAWGFDWETWRESQSTPPDDTQANRVEYAKERWAAQLRTQIARWLSEYRRRGDDEGAEIDA